MICVKITKNNVSKVVPLVDQQAKVNGTAHVFTEQSKMLIGNTLYPVERPIDKHLNGLYYAYQNKLYRYNTGSFEMELIVTEASGTWSYAGENLYRCNDNIYYVYGTTATLVSGASGIPIYITNYYYKINAILYYISGATATLVSGLPSPWFHIEGPYYMHQGISELLYYVSGATATLVSGLPSQWYYKYGDYFQGDFNLYYIPRAGSNAGTAQQVTAMPGGWKHIYNNFFAVGATLYYVSETTVTELVTDTSGSWYGIPRYTGNYLGCGPNLYKVSSGTVTLLGSGSSGTWYGVRQFLLACGPDLYYTGYGAAANSLVPIENLPSGWEYLGDYFFAVGTSVYRVGLSSNGTGYAWSVSGLPSGWMYLKDNYFYKGSDLYYVTSTGTSYKAYKVTGLSSGWEYITDKRFHCGTSLYGISGNTSSGYSATLLTVTKADTWEHIYGNIYACGTELYDLNASQYGTSDADIARLPFYFYNS